MAQEVSETNVDTPLTKQGITGVIPLTGYIYENGNKTIEFGTGVEDGKTYGTFAIKTDGVVLSSEEGAYACYNGKLLLGAETGFTISDDYSTITINGTVYTKR